MKLHHKNTALFLLSCWFTLGIATAQTSNIGEITVTPGTQFSVVDNFTNASNASFVNNGEAFIYRDFTNNGSVDFTPGFGEMRFEGSIDQIIAGANPSYFYNVQLNNNSNTNNAIDIIGMVSIENEAVFNAGIVNTISNNGRFILKNTARAVNMNAVSFVDGFVEKEGGSDFIFPIGDANFYRYAAISFPATSNAIFRGRYVFQDKENLYPTDLRMGNLKQIDDTEYWVVESMLSNEAVLLTLSWDEFTTTPFDLVDGQDTALRIVRWNPIDKSWRVAGGVADALNKTITTRAVIDGKAVFTIGRVNEAAILPGEVVVYNAVSPNGNGQNDYLFIENIQSLPNNTVQVYNRWGTKVFETTNYDTTGNVFRGQSKSIDDTLPAGTFFYIISYTYTEDTETKRLEKAGFLYLNTD